MLSLIFAENYNPSSRIAICKLGAPRGSSNGELWTWPSNSSYQILHFLLVPHVTQNPKRIKGPLCSHNPIYEIRAVLLSQKDISEIMGAQVEQDIRHQQTASKCFLAAKVRLRKPQTSGGLGVPERPLCTSRSVGDIPWT